MEWSHGKVMEKSLNFIPNFQYEPCSNNNNIICSIDSTVFSRLKPAPQITHTPVFLSQKEKS